MNRSLLFLLLLPAFATWASQETAVATPALSLQQLLDLAFERNPDLQAAAERIGAAEATVAEAQAAFYPKLTGRVGYAYSNDPAMAFSAIVSQRRYSAGQNINQPGFVENFRPELVGTVSLFRGGQDYYRKKAAELGVEAAELERSAVHNQLAASVTSAYYAALTAPRQVEVARRSMQAVDSELEHTRDRYREGVALRSDVLSLEVRHGEARESELRALNAVELSRSALRSLIGLRQDEALNLREASTDNAAPALAKTDHLLTQALVQRPEMLAAARQIEMREKQVRAEKGGHLPRVNAQAAYGLNERSPEFNFGRDNLTIGVSAEVDFFAGGAVQARVDGAERRLAEARAVAERTRLEIEDEVRRAEANVKVAVARLDVAQIGEKAATEALRLVHEQYRGGTATVTRYLEAQADHADAEMRAISAGYDLQVARAQLNKALGNWK